MAKTPELMLASYFLSQRSQHGKNCLVGSKKYIFQSTMPFMEDASQFPHFVTRKANNFFIEGQQLRAALCISNQKKAYTFHPHSTTKISDYSYPCFFLLPLNVLANRQTQLLLLKLRNSIEVTALYSVYTLTIMIIMTPILTST